MRRYVKLFKIYMVMLHTLLNVSSPIHLHASTVATKWLNPKQKKKMHVHNNLLEVTAAQLQKTTMRCCHHTQCTVAIKHHAYRV